MQTLVAWSNVYEYKKSYFFDIGFFLGVGFILMSILLLVTHAHDFHGYLIRGSNLCLGFCFIWYSMKVRIKGGEKN